MLIEEALLLVVETPLAHDTSAAAYDTAEACVGEVYVVQTDSGMDSEVVHSLLTLLDERVAVYFPAEVFHLAVHLLQCLIDRHGAYRYRTVSENPLSCLVDIVSGREVHHGVAAPFARPYRLVHLFLDA